MSGVAVHLDGLRRTFGAVHALDNLDLSIEAGEGAPRPRSVAPQGEPAVASSGDAR